MSAQPIVFKLTLNGIVTLIEDYDLGVVVRRAVGDYKLTRENCEPKLWATLTENDASVVDFSRITIPCELTDAQAEELKSAIKAYKENISRCGARLHLTYMQEEAPYLTLSHYLLLQPTDYVSGAIVFETFTAKLGFY